MQDPQQYNSADVARQIDRTIREVMSLSAQVQVGVVLHGSWAGTGIILACCCVQLDSTHYWLWRADSDITMCCQLPR
jgi:hypothetical protein